MIDSNQELCASIARYFQENRPDLVLEATAQNGIDGLSNVARYQPDCVIMDLMLPDLDGITVLERITQLGLPHMPRILVLSSFCSEAVMISLSHLGVDFFMLKPCDLCAVADRVQQMGLVPRRFANTQAIPCVNPESCITEALQKIGIPVHIQGYRYLRTAVEVVINEDRLLDSVTKMLYPTIAELNNTTPSRVERAMRHAISVAWKEDNIEVSQYLRRLGLRRSKPTNSEFIASLASSIRTEIYGMY